MLKAALARPRHPGVRSGFTSYYAPVSIVPSSTVNAMTANRPYYVPFYLGPAVVDRISINITIGSAGNCRLGLYTNTNGLPDQLIVDAGAASTSGTGVAELSFTALTLPDAFVWAVAHFDATPTVTVGNATGNDILGTLAVTGGSRGLTKSSEAYAVLPTTAHAPDAAAQIAPLIALRKS